MTKESRVPSIEGISGDEDRINALYAPFRPRHINKEHYDRKMKFWIKAVEEYCEHCKRVSFTLNEVKVKFGVNGRTPACLPEVIDELDRSGAILPEKKFYEQLTAAEGWKSWSQVKGKQMLATVGSYVFAPISFLSRPNDEELRYINEEQLKILMERVVSETSLLNKLVSVEKWKSGVTELTGIREPTDIEHMLGYLRSKKCIILDKVGSENVIKMGPVGTSPEISIVEKGKYDIVRTKEILESQMENMNEKKVQAEEKARACLKQGLRSTAKHELRRKKLLEQRVDKLLTMVDNLSVLEAQIEDAESDAVLISAYETGKKALTGVLADKKLNADHVTETMLDIQELLDQHSDISAALSQPMDNQDPDLAALESELDEILKEDEEKKEASKHTPAAAGSALTKEEEEEVLQALEALGVDDGLDDFSEPAATPSPKTKLDKSGDV